MKSALNHGSKPNLGFWMYIMTDCVLFATLFATYAVLRDNNAGGATEQELFNLNFVLGETAILLISSFACGIAVISARMKQKRATMIWLALTIALGLAFLGMELWEFNHLILEGESWKESAFLSAFFTLVGTHGLHILGGLIWAISLFFVIGKRDISADLSKKLGLFSIFWHFLDVVWIFIFTIVYLIGAGNL